MFDVELIEIKAAPPPKSHDPHDPHASDPHASKDQIPPPPDVSAPPADAKKSPKGVSYKILVKGTQAGANPKSSDRVRVHYTGWTTDGKMFDSSVQRGEPSEFGLTQVIAGWTDAIPLLQVGDKGRFWIPEDLAYKGQRGKPAGMLVFDVELLEIK
ncbi:MAG: FKBP-type peptidyl-prolyl cis-trans isomerase [Kofleriaceae bacterium]